MDYDGNDFQNQNFQLNGEDNNRFSSGLRAFSLPKFELDDHFQVSLRFDGLVEPEPLIDIRDQEERNWIEDFSSNNASLDFSPVPAEPCSISRRKNVWSEATSSESVEILLKSVREDDLMNKRTFFIDLSAQNEVTNMSNRKVASATGEEVKAMEEEPKNQPANLQFVVSEDRNPVIDSAGRVPKDGLTEVISDPADVSVVSEELLDGGNNNITPRGNISDDKSVEKDAENDHSGLVTVEETRGAASLASPASPSSNITEKDMNSLTLNILPVGRHSGISMSFESEQSHSVHEALSEPSPLLMEDYGKHELTEKDGLLEDVAHQIENQGKMNSSSGQVVPLHDQRKNEVGRGFIDAKKSAWLESHDLGGKNNIVTHDPIAVSEVVVVPVEDEDATKILAEREKEVENQVAASFQEQKEDTSAQKQALDEVEPICALPVSTETRIGVGNKDKDNEIRVDDDSACITKEIVMEVDEMTGNTCNLPVKEIPLTEENITGSEVEHVELNTDNIRLSDSDDLKTDAVEKPLESSDQHHVMDSSLDTEGTRLVEVTGYGEKSPQLADASAEDDSSPLEPVCGSPTIISLVKSHSGRTDEQELYEQSGKESSESAPAKDLGENSKDEERNFTFNVGSRDASEESPVSGWKSFSVVDSIRTPKTLEKNSATPDLGKGDKMELGESDKVDTASKRAHKDKSKTEPSTVERSMSRKRSTPKETSAPVELTGNRDGSPGEERNQQSFSGGGGPNQSDLSTGSPLTPQPFTDEQQVQLRAQIYVYGYLIQGIPPDEACMVAAFGNNECTDSARSSWEGTWRLSLERFRGPKSPPSAAFATPLPSNAGPRAAEQSPRSVVQSKTPANLTASRSMGKCTSTAISNLIPLSSPTWQDASQSSASRAPLVDPNPIFSSTHAHPASHSKQGMPSGGASWLPSVSSVHLMGLSSNPSLSSILDKGTSPFPPQLTTDASPPSIREFAATSLVPTLPVEPLSEKKTASSSQKARKRKKGDDSPTAEHEVATSPPEKAQSQSNIAVFQPSPPPTRFQVAGDNGKEQRVVLSEDTCSKIELSRLQAEDAAVFSAAAIRHSEGIWAQLTIQRNSGLASEIEAKLAAAAVAAAAASSVAKAAAAVAKVASDAAMQAKLMADEAVAFKGNERAIGSTVSVISAAKEAARRRVEAATAASKRAENLDAIVRAAELAAIAVCQAGAVVAMGDPLPFTLNDLLAAGPEGHWKVPTNSDWNVDSVAVNTSNGGFGPKHGNLTAINEGNFQEQSTMNVSEPQNVEEHYEGSLKEGYIQKGSLVEVLLDKDNARIWYSANVLSLKDGEALVRYNDLPPDSGVDEQKEWVPLDGDIDQPPRIRIAHPLMTVKNEGTKKRRRSVTGNNMWAVGDRVDALIHNGWCEGVVTEKNKDDETKLTVHFSGGEISILRAWQLRPSLVWKDGQWIEWSRLRENTFRANQGDTPKDKRQKVARPEVEDYPKFKIVELHEEPATVQQPVELRSLLSLSDKERVFSFGKSVGEIVPNPPRRLRSGAKDSAQSRVIFGVPKPGKRRKFMEVSKQYVKPEATAKYLLPTAASKGRKLPGLRPPRSVPRPEEKHHRQPDKEGFCETEQPSSSSARSGHAWGSKKKAPEAEERPGSAASDVPSELRRSNRRIQPTSRLLEGLQSSMVAPSKLVGAGASKVTPKHPPPSKHGKAEGDQNVVH